MLELSLAVFAGGAAGSAARFIVSNWIQSRWRRAFPWGTLAVNVVGAVSTGFALYLLALDANAEAAALLVIGFLGGFTTMSAFALDTVLLHERRGHTAAYVAASVGLGIGGVIGGAYLASALF